MSTAAEKTAKQTLDRASVPSTDRWLLYLFWAAVVFVLLYQLGGAALFEPDETEDGVDKMETPDPQTFVEGFGALTEWFDALPYAPEQIVLGGFSQGAVMSYALGLGTGRPRTKGLIALSGFIPTVDGWQPDLESTFPPIAIAHGTYDPVIPVEFGRRARATLEAAGADVWYRESPLEHGIDPQVIPQLRALPFFADSG